MGCHLLLQGISAQGLNLGLPHYRQILYRLSCHPLFSLYKLCVFLFPPRNIPILKCFSTVFHYFPFKKPFFRQFFPNALTPSRFLIPQLYRVSFQGLYVYLCFRHVRGFLPTPKNQFPPLGSYSPHRECMFYESIPINP